MDRRCELCSLPIEKGEPVAGLTELDRPFCNRGQEPERGPEFVRVGRSLHKRCKRRLVQRRYARDNRENRDRVQAQFRQPPLTVATLSHHAPMASKEASSLPPSATSAPAKVVDPLPAIVATMPVSVHTHVPQAASSLAIAATRNGVDIVGAVEAAAAGAAGAAGPVLSAGDHAAAVFPCGGSWPPSDARLLLTMPAFAGPSQSAEFAKLQWQSLVSHPSVHDKIEAGLARLLGNCRDDPTLDVLRNFARRWLLNMLLPMMLMSEHPATWKGAPPPEFHTLPLRTTTVFGTANPVDGLIVALLQPTEVESPAAAANPARVSFPPIIAAANIAAALASENPVGPLIGSAAKAAVAPLLVAANVVTQPAANPSLGDMAATVVTQPIATRVPGGMASPSETPVNSPVALLALTAQNGVIRMDGVMRQDASGSMNGSMNGSMSRASPDVQPFASSPPLGAIRLAADRPLVASAVSTPLTQLGGRGNEAEHASHRAKSGPIVLSVALPQTCDRFAATSPWQISATPRVSPIISQAAAVRATLANSDALTPASTPGVGTAPLMRLVTVGDTKSTSPAALSAEEWGPLQHLLHAETVALPPSARVAHDSTPTSSPAGDHMSKNVRLPTGPPVSPSVMASIGGIAVATASFPTSVDKTNRNASYGSIGSVADELARNVRGGRINVSGVDATKMAAAGAVAAARQLAAAEGSQNGLSVSIEMGQLGATAATGAQPSTLVRIPHIPPAIAAAVAAAKAAAARITGDLLDGNRTETDDDTDFISTNNALYQQNVSAISDPSQRTDVVASVKQTMMAGTPPLPRPDEPTIGAGEPTIGAPACQIQPGTRQPMEPAIRLDTTVFPSRGASQPREPAGGVCAQVQPAIMAPSRGDSCAELVPAIVMPSASCAPPLLAETGGVGSVGIASVALPIDGAPTRSMASGEDCDEGKGLPLPSSNDCELCGKRIPARQHYVVAARDLPYCARGATTPERGPDQVRVDFPLHRHCKRRLERRRLRQSRLVLQQDHSAQHPSLATVAAAAAADASMAAPSPATVAAAAPADPSAKDPSRATVSAAAADACAEHPSPAATVAAAAAADASVAAPQLPPLPATCVPPTIGAKIPSTEAGLVTVVPNSSYAVEPPIVGLLPALATSVPAAVAMPHSAAAQLPLVGSPDASATTVVAAAGFSPAVSVSAVSVSGVGSAATAAVPAAISSVGVSIGSAATAVPAAISSAGVGIGRKRSHAVAMETAMETAMGALVDTRPIVASPFIPPCPPVAPVALSAQDMAHDGGMGSKRMRSSIEVAADMPRVAQATSSDARQRNETREETQLFAASSDLGHSLGIATARSPNAGHANAGREGRSGNGDVPSGGSKDTTRGCGDAKVGRGSVDLLLQRARVARESMTLAARRHAPRPDYRPATSVSVPLPPLGLSFSDLLSRVVVQPPSPTIVSHFPISNAASAAAHLGQPVSLPTEMPIGRTIVLVPSTQLPAPPAPTVAPAPTHEQSRPIFPPPSAHEAHASSAPLPAPGLAGAPAIQAVCVGPQLGLATLALSTSGSNVSADGCVQRDISSSLTAYAALTPVDAPPPAPALPPLDPLVPLAPLHASGSRRKYHSKEALRAAKNAQSAASHRRSGWAAQKTYAQRTGHAHAKDYHRAQRLAASVSAKQSAAVAGASDRGGNREMAADAKRDARGVDVSHSDADVKSDVASAKLANEQPRVRSAASTEPAPHLVGATVLQSTVAVVATGANGHDATRLGDTVHVEHGQQQQQQQHDPPVMSAAMPRQCDAGLVPGHAGVHNRGRAVRISPRHPFGIVASNEPVTAEEWATLSLFELKSAVGQAEGDPKAGHLPSAERSRGRCISFLVEQKASRSIFCDYRPPVIMTDQRARNRDAPPPSEPPQPSASAASSSSRTWRLQTTAASAAAAAARAADGDRDGVSVRAGRKRRRQDDADQAAAGAGGGDSDNDRDNDGDEGEGRKPRRLLPAPVGTGVRQRRSARRPNR